jgi:hypothetical protein
MDGGEIKEHDAQRPREFRERSPGERRAHGHDQNRAVMIRAAVGAHPARRIILVHDLRCTEGAPGKVGFEIITETGLEHAERDEQPHQHQSMRASRQSVAARKKDDGVGDDVEDLETREIFGGRREPARGRVDDKEHDRKVDEVDARPRMIPRRGPQPQGLYEQQQRNDVEQWKLEPEARRAEHERPGDEDESQEDRGEHASPAPRPSRLRADDARLGNVRNARKRPHVREESVT